MSLLASPWLPVLFLFAPYLELVVAAIPSV